MDTGDRPAAGKRVRTYGPEHYLVDVACGSDYVRGTLDILESCIMNSAGHVLLHGDYGSGKSRMLEAAIAMCEERSVAVQVLFPDETQPEALLKSVQSDEPVCAFEIDDSLSSGIRKELLERVREHEADPGDAGARIGDDEDVVGTDRCADAAPGAPVPGNRRGT